MWQPAVRAGQVTRAIAVLLIAGAASSACYTYVPVSVEGVQPKEDVRLRVTETAAARLAKDLGSFSTVVDGQFAPEGPDSVSIGVAIDRSYRGTTIGTTSQALFLARSEIVDVRKREFSRSRTILLGAGTVAGFGLLALGIVQLVDPNGAPDAQAVAPPPSALLRPSWLTSRGPTSVTDATPATASVFMGGTFLGRADYLQQMRVAEVTTVKYWEPGAASARFGMGHPRGVIEITRK